MSRSPLARLRILSGREVCRILETHDFVEVRRRGSPMVMQKASTEGTVTVPFRITGSCAPVRCCRSFASPACRVPRSAFE